MEPRAIKRPEDKPGNLKEIYRRWFELLKKQVEECTYSDSGKANLVEMNKRHLYGMLELMNAEGAISDKEMEKLCSEVDRIFDTRRLYGFACYTKMEVFYADNQ